MLLNRRLTLLLPLVAALGATGCVSQPTITVHHAEVRGASLLGVDLTIVLLVHNDNAYDVQVRGVRCNVIFGRGTTLGPIEFAPNVWLPAHQTTPVMVPVSIPWTLVPALASESAGSYSIPYHVRGVVDVTATSSFNIQRNDYSIDNDGFVPRQMVVDAARRMIPIPF
jgi:hypothetical protein